MSDTTHIHGTINISPDFETVGSVPRFDSVKLEYRTLQQDPGPEGVFAPVVAIISGITAEAPEYVDEDMVVNDLTAIIAGLPDNTTFDGFFEARSVDYGNMWRVYIVDRKPVIVEPEIVWPEVPGADTA